MLGKDTIVLNGDGFAVVGIVPLTTFKIPRRPVNFDVQIRRWNDSHRPVRGSAVSTSATGTKACGAIASET